MVEPRRAVTSVRSGGALNRSESRSTPGFGGARSYSQSNQRDDIGRVVTRLGADFHDEIRITGQPQSLIPIGTATFYCLSTVSLRQRADTEDSLADARLFSSFSAQALETGSDSAVELFDLGRRSVQATSRTLLAIVSFIIGQPIKIDSMIRLSAREETRPINETRRQFDSDFSATNTLLPVHVVGVRNPRVSSDSGSQYHLSPSAVDVVLLSESMRLTRG